MKNEIKLLKGGRTAQRRLILSRAGSDHLISSELVRNYNCECGESFYTRDEALAHRRAALKAAISEAGL